MNDEHLRCLPHRFDAAALPAYLDKIGLPLSPTSEVLLAQGVPLNRHGKQYTVEQVDAALEKTRLTNRDRLTVKLAMARNGLLLRNAA